MAPSRKDKALPFSRGDLVELKSGGPCMVVHDVTKGQATCRWFSGESLKEKSFYLEEISVAQQGGLIERLDRARERIAARETENVSKYDLARRLVFAVEQAKRTGEKLPQAIIDLVEQAQKAADASRE